MKIPIKLENILYAIHDNGFTPLIVGGAVRDTLMGITPEDFDIEVYGCNINELETILSTLGHVDVVGKSFGILKMDNAYDFSVPRRENKIGIGHKDFEIIFDKNISFEEAAARRDFTFNSLAYNPITEELLDFFGGVDDIKNKIIRHTSDAFSEDPLRVLRGLQFQSRLGFTFAPETIIKMKEMILELHTIPVERISNEMMKWAIKGQHPEYLIPTLSAINTYTPELKSNTLFLPELALLDMVEQDEIFHAEGSVSIHTNLCLKKMNELCIKNNITGDDKAVLIFAILLHDIGKLTTTITEYVEKHNRFCITSKGHEEESARLAIDTLQSIGIKPSLIDRIIPLIKYHLSFVNILHITGSKGKKSALLKLSRKLHPSTIQELMYVYEADYMGRIIPDKTADDLQQELNDKLNFISSISTTLEITFNPRKSILMGRHLIAKGLTPGLIFGNILRAADEAQDNLEFYTIDEALIWLENYLKK